MCLLVVVIIVDSYTIIGLESLHTKLISSEDLIEGYEVHMVVNTQCMIKVCRKTAILIPRLDAHTTSAIETRGGLTVVVVVPVTIIDNDILAIDVVLRSIRIGWI